jgi:RimJ/RimL family protein N-acetyltransferase
MQTLARSLFKEASNYGFQQQDYVRFVNLLLDQAMGMDRSATKTVTPLGTLKTLITKRAKRLPLKGKNVQIRAFQNPQDQDILKKWLEDEAGKYFILSRTTAESLELPKLVDDASSVLGIIDLPDGTPIGVMAFLDHDPRQNKAELRKLIGETRMRGRGLGKEATDLWIQYGFSALGLKKIYLNTFETNIRNIRLNEELGFRVEGILHNEVLVGGKYKDVLRMGLWKS